MKSMTTMMMMMVVVVVVYICRDYVLLYVLRA